MSVERQKNGRWKVRVDVGGRASDRRRIVRTVDDLETAKQLEKQLRRRGVEGHRRTVLDVVDRHLELYGPNMAPNYENGLRSLRDIYIAPTWLGRLELDFVDADELERFYAEVAAGKHSPPNRPGRKSRSTVNKIHRLLSVAFGSHRRWISPNPCLEARVKVGVKPVPSAADDYDLGDVARTLDAARLLSSSKHAGGKNATRVVELSVELEDLAQFTVATGARAGEVAGVRWCDLELVDGVVAFHGSISRKRRADGPGFFRKEPKTGKPRKLVVDEACRAMLEARYARQVDQARAAGVGVDELERCAAFSLELEHDYTSPAAVGMRWRRAKAKAEVGLRYHDLRHVNASEMSNAGVPVQSAIARTGHASARMYHDTYGHHRADLNDPAVAVLAKTWQNISAKRKAPKPDVS